MIYFIVLRYNNETGAQEAIGTFSSRQEAERWMDKNEAPDWEMEVLLDIS